MPAHIRAPQFNHFLLIVLALCLPMLSTAAWAEAPVWGVDVSPPPVTSESFSADRIIVKMKSGVSRSRARQVLSRVAGKSALKSFSYIDLSILDVGQDERSVGEIVAELNAMDSVDYAEPDFVLHLYNTPGDPSFGLLWGLENTGQSGGISGADIGAPRAWGITTGSSEMVVGVTDTGVDYTHEDLAANIWTNPGEIPGNGIDDDNNGYVDDIHGINAITGSGDPMDDEGHGTHVAGTIGAVGDNGVGVTGVNWNVKMMALKFLDASGGGYTSDAIECLDYVLMMKNNHGVNIRLTNNSWGGGGYSRALYEAIDAAGKAGMLFMAAAGNSSTNNDAAPSYPASYELDNIISVASVNNRDGLSSFSSYGKKSVDLGAPGSNILSTLPGNAYGFYSGTSMATPHVAGAAALIWAGTPSYDATQVKALILSSVDPVAVLQNTTVTGGRLNVANALYTLKPPSANAGGPYSGAVDSIITLDAGASFDPDGRITAYAWDWESDGTFDEILETPVTEHAWALAGTFTVTLKVTNNSGLSSISSTSVTISEGLSADPSALKLGPGESSAITVTGGTAPYTALSSAPEIASVYMDDETALVTGNGQGEAVITIADTDGNRTEVLVTAHIPLAVSPAGLTLAEGETGSVTILSGLPPYTVETDDPAVATAGVSGTTVTVTAASLFSMGSTVMTVSDAEGTNVDVVVTVDPFTNVTNLVIDEFGEGFTFDFDSAYDAGFGTLVFQVKDQNGLPVNGLSIENFAFEQNGIPADVESFSDVTEETILKVSLVLDASYSLTVNGADEKLKEAADALVEKLGARAEFRYYRFANRVTEINAVDDLAFDEMDRFTSMYDAVSRAIEDTTTEVEKRIIVLFSDGQDNHSLKSLSELTSEINKKEITVYSVGLGDVSRPDLDAVSTNGEVVIAEDADALMSTFDTIGNYLQSIYTVTYWTPSRRGIHELGFRVHANGINSNTIETLFEASAENFAAVPNGIRSPLLTVEKDGTKVTVSWESVGGAEGYTLFYAPPDISFVKSIDAGKINQFELELWSGFAYYIALQPYNAGNDTGGLSNIELIEIP